MGVGGAGKLLNVQNNEGGVGDGLPNTALVLGWKAAFSSSSEQLGSTKVKSMPIRFMVTAKRLKVPP